ncbi:MAG: hypothetical protein ACTSVB_06330 [Candidatus Heimdallarchaeaceae archaeon]
MKTKSDKKDDEDPVATALYEAVRCSLYHVGLTKGPVELSNEFPTALITTFNAKQKLLRLQINPKRLAIELLKHIDIFANKLYDSKNVVLRKNFEARFDFDSRVTK